MKTTLADASVSTSPRGPTLISKSIDLPPRSSSVSTGADKCLGYQLLVHLGDLDAARRHLSVTEALDASTAAVGLPTLSHGSGPMHLAA